VFTQVRKKFYQSIPSYYKEPINEKKEGRGKATGD
jgi:hypothetical protein